VIINHNKSFASQENPRNLSIEAKIFYDADTLDALGAIGIIRMILFSENQKIPYFSSRGDKVDSSFYGNIKFLKNIEKNLMLPLTKKIAKKRMKIVKNLLKQIENEYK
jgi:HD superfamily phosphodiesterase